MELVIENVKDPAKTESFACWLCDLLHNEAMNIFPRDFQKEEEWDKYFRDENYGWTVVENKWVCPPTVTFLLYSFFDNLIAIQKDRESNEVYKIKCSPFTKLRKSNMTIEAAVDLMTNGNLFIEGYSYIKDIFDTISENIDDYYQEFLYAFDFIDEDGNELPMIEYETTDKSNDGEETKEDKESEE